MALNRLGTRLDLETRKKKEMNGIEVKNHINYFLSCDQMLPMIYCDHIAKKEQNYRRRVRFKLLQPTYLGWGK